MLAQQFVNAISLGGVYALFALGFTLVFGVLNVLNLAHGAVFMLGAYAALQGVVLFRLPILAAIVLAMMVTAPFAAKVADRHFVVERGQVVDRIEADELEAASERLNKYLSV